MFNDILGTPMYTRLIPALLAAAFSLSAMGADIPTLTLVSKDGHFQPQVLEVQAGKRFKILVRNEGHYAMEFESHALHKEKVVAPGRAVVVSIPPLKAGEYPFFDEFHERTGKGRVVAR